MTQKRLRDLLVLLNEYRVALDAEGKEDAADHVADVLDGITGWCSPSWRLDDFLRDQT